MDKENIFVFGASEHARYTIDIIEQEGRYSIVGVIDSSLKIGDSIDDYKVIGSVSNLIELAKSHNVYKGIVAIGDNFTRYIVVQQILKEIEHFHFVSIVHPNAVLGKNVKIGQGSLIMAGAIITNDVVIGDHCFIATKASFAHDSVLGDFSSLNPGVTTGGNVNIGKCTAIAIGTNIIHGITIGDHTVVGSSSLVLKDIGDNVLSFGIPAKVIRSRAKEDKYL